MRGISWNPNGKLLASTSFDGTTGIWEKEGDSMSYINQVYECIATLEGHENEVKAVSWSASGTLLATSSRDKSVWIWEGT